MIQFVVLTIRFFWGLKVNLSFSDLMSWLAIEIALGSPIMFDWLFKEDYAKKIFDSQIERYEREKLEREKVKKLEYSNKLAEELERRTHGSLIFVDDSFWNLHTQLTNPNLTQTVSAYSDDLNDYLKSEHKDMWDTISKIKLNVAQHELDLQAFLGKLNLEIRNYLQKTFKMNERMVGENPQHAPKKYYFSKHLPMIGWHIQYHYKNGKLFEFSRISIDWGVGQQYLLELSGVHIVVSDNRDEIVEIEKKLKCIFNDAIGSDEFTKLKKDFGAIKGKLDSFEKEAPEIINDLKRGRLGNYKPTMD